MATIAAKTIRETGGWAEEGTDAEIVDGMKLLAETEGIFTETAGGVTGRREEADRARRDRPRRAPPSSASPATALKPRTRLQGLKFDIIEPIPPKLADIRTVS